MFDNWTLGALTIPSRDRYVRKMLDSIEEERENGLGVKILYNCHHNERVRNLAEGLSEDYPEIETLFYDSKKDYGVPEGKNYLIRATKTPLIAIIDDDCSFGTQNILGNLEETLKRTSLGLVGIPSYERDSDVMFKPREECPKSDIGGILYMDVEGMFLAGYTKLLKDLNGFNERKKFRVDCADLNTMLHRTGITTGIDMNAGCLRHWSDAPGSPTRDRETKHQEFLYGLLVTAIEFGHNDFSPNTRMWDVISERLLKKSYQNSPTDLIKGMANILPRIIDDSKEIQEYKDFLDKLPFQFMPFEKISEEDWRELINYSSTKVEKYKSDLGWV